MYAYIHIYIYIYICTCIYVYVHMIYSRIRIIKCTFDDNRMRMKRLLVAKSPPSAPLLRIMRKMGARCVYVIYVFTDTIYSLTVYM